jgi:hypothetical protein
MNASKHGIRLLGALMLFTLSADGFAQSPTTYKHLCIAVGVNTTEPLPDRAGQSLTIGDFVCTTEGGPLDGATVTGRTINHYDGLTGTALSGNGVTRRPGGQVYWQATEQRTEIKMSEGRVTGFDGVGRGRFVLTTGAYSALNGKAYSYKFNSTGPGRFTVDVSLE